MSPAIPTGCVRRPSRTDGDAPHVAFVRRRGDAGLEGEDGAVGGEGVEYEVVPCCYDEDMWRRA